MKKNVISGAYAILVLSGLAASMVSAEVSTRRTFGKNHAFTIEELPSGKLKSRLLTLSPPAREKAMNWLHSLTFESFDAADHLRVDHDGGIYIVCPDGHEHCNGDHHSGESAEALEPPDVLPGNDPAVAAPGTGRAPVSVKSPPAYHSKPGAPYHIYLDFNGAIVAGKAWNASRNVASWDCVAWSTDADRTQFSDSEQAEMRRVWERISEDYAPFDINVTTDVSYDPDNYKGDKNKVGWLLFTPTTDKNNRATPHNGSGGVAYVGVFGINSYFDLYQPAWVTPASSANMAEAGSHEMGHNMGLVHDGTSSREYYGGHTATGTAPSWGPLMGTGYDRDVSQWSKGEYYDANETENDLATISSKVPYRDDDHGDSFGAATVWTDGVIDQDGIVEQTGNPDFFEFTTGAGPVSFTANTYRCDVATWGGNLDILLELYDESFTLVASNNPAAETNAVISTTVEAGTYYLALKPSAAGNPTQNPPSGYKLYGSLGQYNITGNIVPTNAVVLTQPNGGEFWSGGTTQTITWVSAMGGNVKIELLKNDSFDSTVIASTPNDGSYDWSIPPGLTAAADYRIRITSVESPDKTDTSLSDFTISPTPLPEISVEQPPGTELVDGVSTMDFGVALLGSPVPLTITIRNTGTADLTGLAVSKSGADAGDFAVDTLAETLSPGAEATLTVVFTPSGLGARNASLQISSNDADENPFDLVLSGFGQAPPAPDITVEQPVGTGLADGASTVDFGNSNLGVPSTLTFTIRNEGDAGLAGLFLSKSGAHAGDFTLGFLRSSTLAPGGTLTFTVTFTPSASGSRTATMLIASNDPDENPFEIELMGMGVIPFVPGIVIEESPGEALKNGKPMKGFGFVDLGLTESRTFTIRNSGIANLTGLTATTSGSHFSDFVVGTFGATTLAPGEETTLVVTFAPSHSGTRYAMLHIGSNDPDDNPFDIELTGSGVVPQIPEIAVEHPLQTNLVDGTAALAFGNTNIRTPIIKTVTVANTGTADLTDLAISLSGKNTSDFALGALGATTLASGASTTFTVTFKPSTAGVHGANLQITSNDADENPFDIVLSGTGVVPPFPEIVVEHPAGTGLIDGVSTLVFGNPIIGTPVTKAIVIRNAGTANLTGLAVARSGTNASDFAIGALESITLAPGASTTFTVTFTPSAAGEYSAGLLISSNDGDENPFEVTLLGTGKLPPAPEIAVEHPAGTTLVDGASALTFGNSNIGTSVAKTVTVRNTGTANLTGLAITHSGMHSPDFALGSLRVTTLAPGASTTFTVAFTPTASGNRSDSLRIVSNDADENPFDIALSGTGVIPPVPEIVAEHPAGTSLVDGTATLAFGTSNIGVPVSKTVTIRNTGTANLTGLAVTRSGTHAADFATGALGSVTLAPGASTIFTVTFTPSASGTRSAALRIASNDADENPFDIALGGIGVVPPASEIVVEQGKGSNKNLTDNESSRDFGQIKVGTTSKAMVFTIKNTGKAPLTRVNAILRGKQAKDFKVVNKPARSVAPGKSTQFKVIYKPGGARVSNATLQIASNDADENPFRVKLTGKGVR
jgi:uncharacterized cupredoxin-like copper-binding protein